MTLTPQQKSIVIRAGNWAGPEFSAGADLTELLSYSKQVQQIYKGYTSADPRYAPTSFVDAAAREHDLGYWYAEDNFRTGLIKTFGVASESQLTSDQRTSDEFKQLETQRTNGYFEADIALIRNVLAWQPTDAISIAYRELMLDGFYLKASIYGKSNALMDLHWSELHAIDPNYMPPGIPGIVGGLALANHWRYTEMQALLTSGLSTQEIGFFNQHLTRASGLDTGSGGDVLVRPTKDDSGNFVWEGQIDGKNYRLELDGITHIFTRTQLDIDHNVVGRETWTPDETQLARNNNRAYIYDKTDANGGLLESHLVPAEKAPTTLFLQSNHDAMVNQLRTRAAQADNGLLEGEPVVIDAKPVPVTVSDSGDSNPNNDVITIQGMDASGAAIRTEVRFDLNGPAIITMYKGSEAIARGTLEYFEEDGSSREIINYNTGRVVQTNRDGNENITSIAETIPTFGGGSTTTIRYVSTGTITELLKDREGSILQRTETISNPNGPANVTVYDGAGNVVGRGTLERFEDGSTSQTIKYTDGRTIRVNTDDNGIVTSRATIQTIETGSIETVAYADGHAVKLTYDKDRNLLSQETIDSGSQTLQNAIPTLIDALSILKAIQSGEPLPILASGLTLANHLINPANQPVNNIELDGAANAAGGILSLMSLDAALKRGDTLAAITAGAQALNFGAKAYADIFGATDATKGIDGVLNGGNGVPGVLPVLSLINAISNGDEAGIAVSTLSVLESASVFAETTFAAAIPYIGWAYAVYNIIDSLFGGDDAPEIPDPWGSGSFVWNGTGITYQSAGVTGGNEAVSGVMSSLLTTMNSLIERERQTNPTSSLGIIPNRMPSVGYDMSGYRYTDIDPLTGVERNPSLRFDTSGRPYNAAPGTPESYRSIIEGMVYSALERGAIAPMWEVQTAKMQTDAGDPKAGLTEEERAGRDAKLAPPITGSTQTFRPVVLDLDGDGIEVTDKAHGTAFDVDDSGYLKRTAWVKGDDAFLTLDRNYNGLSDSGRELFSNGTVDLSRRGLAGMNWVDANYDGKLTAADPVWNELKLWRDFDGDGAQDTGEVTTLGALGVTELDYAMGTFTQNGVKKQLASPDLEADKDGTRVTAVPEGILVQTSENGHMSLLVTRIDDKTAVEANRDGITGYEDTEIIASGADLLANDTLGGFLGRDLTITGLTNFRHGTGYVDANKMVHFNPEANYAGSDAGFSYIATAANGQTGTATVDITLQNINDAPTAADQRTYRAIYGYTPLQYETAWDEYGNPYSQVVGGGDPIYQPYSEYAYQWPNGWGYVNHNTPVAQEDTGSGRVAGSDIDDPASSLTYQVIGNPQYGAISMDAQGDYQYTPWAGENGSDGNYYGNTIYPGNDTFQVRVSDPHGASSTLTVNVPHPGSYQVRLPPPGGGGGGGKKPIAIDLNNDGFHFTNVDDSNVFFDVNNDGYRHRTAWPSAGDGLLAYDADGDGKVDHAGEIVLAAYKDAAQSDLEGLTAFDTNGDGIFSAADDKWAKFGVWQDANQNGITDPGEFRSLDELGIASIALSSDGQFSVVDGQTVHGVLKATKTDGGTIDMADVTLQYSNDVLLPYGNGAVASPSPFSPSGEVLEGTAGNDLILGKTGNNVVYGHDGDDVVMEDGGNDIIDGGAGNDVIYAGADNDLVMGGSGNDVVYAGLGNDMVFGGDGNDAIFADQGNDVVFGGAGNDLIAGGAGNDVLSGDAGDDQVYGESGNDALFGRDGNDELAGMDGNDYLNGGAGNDLLDGGSGVDQMIGGTGDDTYVVDDAGDTVVEAAGEGNDTVRSYIDYQLADTLENLTLAGTANLTGRGNDLDNVLKGNSGSNLLEGRAGNDVLDGGAGADTMIGGTGDDTYVVDNAGDIVVENANEGTDTVLSSIDFTLGSTVENLTLTGSAAIHGTGNAGDNVLVGNGSDNVLDGGIGADTMMGGRGNDTYVVNETGDRVIENAGEGNDTVFAAIDYVLPANVENLVLTGAALNATGNELDNVLIGNAGNNVLDGRAGADIMSGNAGNDTYVVDNAGDVVIENANEGTDTVLSSVTYALSANVENMTLTGTADIDATGNELGNVLIGNAGNNVIDGRAGADVMSGNAGNDTYVVDNAGDVVIENANEGADTVLSSVTYALSANVENMTLTGTADIDATGNELDNVLIGNAGNNVIDGHAGADAMSGNAGNDTYVVDNAGDVVIENANEGTDTVLSSVTYALSANVENMTLTGTADINATGNELDNVLIGNAGNNVLDGQAGADTMSGNAGNDIYIVENAGDVVIENAGEGTDTVLSSVTYALSANVENMTLTGTADIDATGNELDNALIGNGGNNVLDGQAGADTMSGGAGDDTYVVDNAGEVVIENANEGTDTVLSSVTYALSANVENMTLTGTADIDATGNELDNVLIGNSGNNVLDGRAGADAMSGNAGNDTYVVDNAGDVVIENANEGTDTVLSSVTYALSANVENMTLTGTADIDATGNELDNVLIGNGGNNVLDGRAGGDTMSGNAGNDTYIVDNAGDVVIENAGEGTDTVLSSVTYALSANVENMTLTGTADIDATGNVLDNVLIGNGGNNVLDGQAGADTMSGNAGNDTYVVDNAGDVVVENAGEGTDTVLSSVTYALSANVENMTLTGTADIDATGNELDNLLIGNSGSNVLDGLAGNDTLTGGIGNDTLIGGTGNDVLNGGLGNDTYVYNWDDDLDQLTDAGGNDTLRFGTGLSLDNVAIRVTSDNGAYTAHLRVLCAGGCEQPDQGIDFAITVDANGKYVSPIESFRFADGSVYTFDDVLIKTQVTYGTSKTRNLTTGRNDDIIYAGPNSNMIYSGTGNDIVYAGGSGDTVYGQGGNDFLVGATSNDMLDGGCGFDVLEGANGNDTLVKGKGNGALLGGSGYDTLTGGSGNDILIGGQHDDTLSTGAGYNIVAFNRNDRSDTILASAGAINTLSLGGGIKETDLSFSKSGNDLVMKAGNNDSITFKGWYADVANRNFVTLQVIEEAATDFNPKSTDPLRNRKIETFDFAALANKFDTALAANPALNSWSLMNGMLDAHLAGSDTTALGGDLAYQYGMRGDLAGMNLAAAQTTLKDPQFGTQAQTVSSWSSLNTGAVRL